MAHAATAGSEQTLALAQRDGEAAAEFAGRVIRRIRALERSGQSVEQTLLLLGPRFEADSTAARLLIARALVTHSATAPTMAAELVLSSTGGDRGELQRWLPGLVDVLLAESESGRMAIAVQLACNPALNGPARPT
jgi:hypothetical protein